MSANAIILHQVIICEMSKHATKVQQKRYFVNDFNVDYQNHNPEVGGSNPPPATKPAEFYRAWCFPKAKGVAGSVLYGTIPQNLWLEREPMARPLGHGDHPVLHRYGIDPQIIGETHVLDPNPVRNRGEQLHVQFGEQMRRDSHAPGIGDG